MCRATFRVASRARRRIKARDLHLYANRMRDITTWLWDGPRRCYAKAKAYFAPAGEPRPNGHNGEVSKGEREYARALRMQPFWRDSCHEATEKWQGMYNILTEVHRRPKCREVKCLMDAMMRPFKPNATTPPPARAPKSATPTLRTAHKGSRSAA